MRHWFKKSFVPHRANGHRPYFLRRPVLVTLLATAVVVELIFVLPSFLLFPRLNFLADVLPAILVNLTNHEREQSQLSDLEQNSLLTLAAQAKAADMAARGYFSHNDPVSGAEPWAWLGKVGYRYDFAGENLAINFVDSADVVRAWMQSPTHRENIVRPNFTQIGIGVATGVYQGRPSIFVVQFFGRPAVATALAGKPANPTTVILSQPAAVAVTPITPVSQPGISLLSVPVQSLTNNVKGESTPAPPTFWQKLLSKPRQTSTAVFLALIGVMMVALFLNIFIHIRIQHPDLIINSLAVVCLLGFLLLANHQLSRSFTRIGDRAAASVYLSTP